MFDFSHRFFEQDKATTSSLRLDEARLKRCWPAVMATFPAAKPIGSNALLAQQSDA
jgi:hypothetical protein